MGWVNFFLAENESHIYLNMCAKFGCGPTVVSKKRGGTDRQTDRQRKLQLYIVDAINILSPGAFIGFVPCCFQLALL